MSMQKNRTNFIGRKENKPRSSKSAEIKKEKY